MSVMFTRNGFAAAALICAIAAGPASSAQPTEPVRFPHKDLIDRVAKTKGGLADPAADRPKPRGCERQAGHSCCVSETQAAKGIATG